MEHPKDAPPELVSLRAELTEWRIRAVLAETQVEDRNRTIETLTATLLTLEASQSRPPQPAPIKTLVVETPRY